jgi:hypothetical protein
MVGAAQTLFDTVRVRLANGNIAAQDYFAFEKPGNYRDSCTGPAAELFL